MAKVKVTKQVAMAIEAYINGTSERIAKHSLLDTHAVRKNNPNAPSWAEVNEDCAILDTLEVWELAEILMNGYEVERTREEIIFDIYNAPTGNLSFERQQGMQEGILLVAKAYGIPLRGVNC